MKEGPVLFEWPARLLWASNGGLVFTELTLWLEADHLLSVHWPRDGSLFDLNSPLPGQHASLPIFIASCGLKCLHLSKHRSNFELHVYVNVVCSNPPPQ